MCSGEPDCLSPKGSSGVPGAATTLHRSSSSDTSFAMAQRLGEARPVCGDVANADESAVFVAPVLGRTARRFKKQIFLSIDVPPAFMALGDGPRLLLAVERAVVDMLKGLDDGDA